MYEACLTNFTPKTAFERELVKGVLFRNGRIPGSGTKTNFKGKRNRILPQETNTLEIEECDSNANNSNLCLLDVTGDSDFEMHNKNEHCNSRSTSNITIPLARESNKFSRASYKVRVRKPIVLQNSSKR